MYSDAGARLISDSVMPAYRTSDFGAAGCDAAAGTGFGSGFAIGFDRGFNTGLGAGFNTGTAAFAIFAAGLLFFAGLRALGVAILAATFFATFATFATFAAFAAFAGFFFTAVARDIAQAL
jgi:hypothetical protein